MSTLVDFILSRTRRGTWRDVFILVLPVFLGLLFSKIAKIYGYELHPPFIDTQGNVLKNAND